MISGLHFGLSGGKPFNPILGETFQCKASNSYCYAEQTCHHPPITNILFINPGKFKQYGYFAMDATMAANAMHMKLKGNMELKFDDGTVYNFTFPEFTVMGIMFGKRYVNWNGQLCIHDVV